MHSAGVNFNFMTYRETSDFGSNNFSILFTNLTWFPRYNLTASENSSISVGLPLGAGVGIANDFYGGASLYYGFDFPLVIDYNIGFKSSPDNENKPGVYFGTGFGYTLTNWTDGSSTQNLNSYGPLLRGGMRFGAATQNHPDWGMTIGLSYKLGLEERKSKTYGIIVLWDF
jgi:hypothetical protein